MTKFLLPRRRSLLVGAAIAAVSLVNGAVITFFLATAIAGIGFGAGFQGAIRTVVPFAAAHERAGVLSIIFVISDQHQAQNNSSFCYFGTLFLIFKNGRR